MKCWDSQFQNAHRIGLNVFLSFRGYISEGKFWMNKVQINRLDNIHFKLIVLHKLEKSRSPNHDRQSILLPIPAVSVSIVKVILHEQPGLLFTSIWREVWNIVFIPVIWILRRWILHKFKIKWKLIGKRNFWTKNVCMNFW